MTPIPCLGPKACSPGCRDYGRTAVSCEPYGTASTDERLWGQDHPLCPEQTNHIQKLVDTGHSSPGPRTARGSLWNCPPLSLTRHCALCPVLRKSVPRWWSHKNSGTTPACSSPSRSAAQRGQCTTGNSCFLESQLIELTRPTVKK